MLSVALVLLILLLIILGQPLFVIIGSISGFCFKFLFLEPGLWI